MIVDHILGTEADESKFINALGSLETIAAGISDIVDRTYLIERIVQDYENKARKKITFYGAGLHHIDEADELKIINYFHWYGNSVCNYSRLIGLINAVHTNAIDLNDLGNPEKAKVISKQCGDYVRSIPELEPILFWRNKVFAHFAAASPIESDSAALLNVSMMSPVQYSNHRFVVGGMTIMTHGSEVTMPIWSVTESFEALRERYWPPPI